MGTRNLTVVVKNDKVVVAQYGQWDGYPDAAGLGILKILSEDLDGLILGVSNCIEADEGIHDSMMKHAEEKVGVNTAPEGFISGDISDALAELYPEQHRNTGYTILKLIADSRTPIYVSKRFDFAADTLFCEWAYVIDLDNGKFETHSGSGNGEQGIFARLGENTVSMIASFDLDNLPSDEQFMLAFDPED